MTADEHFKAARLGEAIDAQIKEVKAHPGDPNKRTFLFELLAFSGDLDRARRQIDAINYGQIELDSAVASYKKLLDAEQKRRDLFKQSLSPRFFGETPQHAQLRLQAVNRLREKNAKEAAERLNQAAGMVHVRGQLNGKPIGELRDCDDLFGGVLEAMAHGEYYWVPLEQVASLAMKPPRFPRDLLWLPAKLEMHDGGTGDVFLPVLYPNTHEHADPQVRLGRATDWSSSDGGPVLGVGGRTFLAGDDAVSLLEFRELALDAPT
jgi:type VI secretion system protein ImpE